MNRPAAGMLVLVAAFVLHPVADRWFLPPGRAGAGRLSRGVARAGRRLEPVARLLAALRSPQPPDDLPLALDLLACALRSGEPPSTAAAAVARALDGPLAKPLREVARAAELGASPEIAWRPMGQLTGMAAVGRAAARAAESGTRLAEELNRIAADQRLRRMALAEARMRRAGVLVVLPLGLCFLPAFVLIGVVPIVIGVAGSLLR